MKSLIRASKRADPQLRPDEDELRRITDLIAQSIIVLDPDGRPQYANRFVLDDFALRLEDVLADGFRERVFHPEDVARLRDERRQKLLGNVPFENEQRALVGDTDAALDPRRMTFARTEIQPPRPRSAYVERSLVQARVSLALDSANRSTK